MDCEHWRGVPSFLNQFKFLGVWLQRFVLFPSLGRFFVVQKGWGSLYMGSCYWHLWEPSYLFPQYLTCLHDSILWGLASPWGPHTWDPQWFPQLHHPSQACQLSHERGQWGLRTTGQLPGSSLRAPYTATSTWLLPPMRVWRIQEG